MKSFKKLSFLSLLFVSGLFIENINGALANPQDNPQVDKSFYKGINWDLQPGDPRYREENKKLLLGLISEFTNKMAKLANFIKEGKADGTQNLDNIKKRLNEIVSNIKLFDFVILDKISGTEYTPLQLVQYHADDYRKNAWNKLTRYERLKWAGLFYWDEATVLWDKLIAAIKDAGQN